MPSSRAARAFLFSVALLLTTGCSSWRAISPPQAAPGARIDQPVAHPLRIPGRVRVRLADGSKVWLENVVLDGDQVRGTIATGESTRLGRAVAYDRHSVRIEQRRFDFANSVAFLALLMLAGGLAAVVAVAGHD